jgi:hypothetical protein
MNHLSFYEKKANRVLFDIFLFIISMWLSLTLIYDLISVAFTFIDESYFTHLATDNFLPVKYIIFYIPFVFIYLFCLTKCYRYLIVNKSAHALLSLLAPLIFIIGFHIYTLCT